MNANKARIVALLAAVAMLCGMVYSQVREVYTYPQSNAQHRVYEHVFDTDDFDFAADNTVLIPAKDPNKVSYYDPNGNPTTDPNFYYVPDSNTLYTIVIDVNYIDVNDHTIDEISTDGTLAGNSDDVVPTEQAVKTYVDAESCPTYKYIKATTQAEGDLHLSAATWAISKAMIYQIRVVTSSTDWDLYVLQNDNGYAANDATIGRFCRVTECSGNATLMMNLPYQDEDASGELHLYYNDDSGANTADFYVFAYEMD